jgi:CRP/FNR family transcriptional regulator, anaerobic regulatory protein
VHLGRFLPAFLVEWGIIRLILLLKKRRLKTGKCIPGKPNNLKSDGIPFVMKKYLRKNFEEVDPLTDEEFDYIARHFEVRRFKKHQFVVQPGMPVIYDNYIVKGCLRAYVVDQQGKEHILHFTTENGWISDYAAHFNDRPATIFIDCLEDCEMYSLTLDGRRKICREFHKMDRFFSIKFNLGFIRLQERIQSLLTQSAEERYSLMLTENPELVQRVPKKYLAAYLGLSRETLSRVKPSVLKAV